MEKISSFLKVPQPRKGAKSERAELNRLLHRRGEQGARRCKVQEARARNIAARLLTSKVHIKSLSDL